MIFERLKVYLPVCFVVGSIGLIMSGLLMGFEPVGEDPDRMYRPLKSELAEALREGRLPFWSYRLGLGVPLIAESHVAAFYPPNLVFYRVFNVPTAYRLLMWLHCVALAATTYFYARTLSIAAWGSALSAVTFTLCGFQAVHSIHEPFYSLMPYLPLALGITERYMATGRPIWLALLAMTLGVQWTLGHFQIQTWTNGLVVLTAVWRVLVDRTVWRRGLWLASGVLWGMAVACIQLDPSWRFAQFVGQTERKIGTLFLFSYPVEHWFEVAVPQVLRSLQFRTEGPYWEPMDTTGFEARFYVGTIPLMLALIGWSARPNSATTVLWRFVVPLSFAAATIPRWWPDVYAYLVSLPVLGLFRGPARYTLLTSLGLSLLAGEGLDRLVSSRRFKIGLSVSLLFAGAAMAGVVFWSTGTSARGHIKPGGIVEAMAWAGVAWSVAILIVLGWRSRRYGAWVPVLATAIELALLYYSGPTKWGTHMNFPGESPVLQAIARDPDARLSSGLFENIPLSFAKGTAHPYIGFSYSSPNLGLMVIQERLLFNGLSFGSDGLRDREIVKNWYRRCGVTHLALSRRDPIVLGEEIGVYRDPVLDEIVYHDGDKPQKRAWRLFRLDEPFSEARIAKRVRTVNHPRLLNDVVSRSVDPNVGFFLKSDGVPARADVENGRVVSWNGTTAVVEHDGTCDLVLARTFDPGWRARIDDGPEQAVFPIDGGFQSVRIPGSGLHRVSFWYMPRYFWIASTISTIAATLAMGIVGANVVGSFRFRGAHPQGLS